MLKAIVGISSILFRPSVFENHYLALYRRSNPRGSAILRSAIQKLLTSSTMALKRKASEEEIPATAKKVKSTLDDYCATPVKKDDEGKPIWPASSEQMADARRIIRDCVDQGSETVICPDKDADGLSAGAILHHTLTAMGLPGSKIRVHLLPKGQTIHTESQRALVASLLSPPCSSDDPTSSSDDNADKVLPRNYLFVLDHGSAPSPALAPPSTTTTLIVDHHHATSTSIPEDAHYVNACSSPPVATTALLTYEICKTLHPSLSSPSHPNAWLMVLGTHGDLGTSLKWDDPFPDPSAIFKTGATRKAINDAVALINAPRRTGTYDVVSAWEAILPAQSPNEVLSGPKSKRLQAARQEVNAEVARCQAYAPKFSYNSAVALVRIESKCQVHPVIATRWAGTLKSAKRLRFVICANTAYLDGMVNFSCRVAKNAKARVEAEKGSGATHGSDSGSDSDRKVNNGTTRATITDDGVDIIAELKSIAKRHHSGTLVERLGSDFARGHVQASGGVVPAQEFEELMSVLRIGEKPPKEDSPVKAKAKSPRKSVQKNTLMGYFAKPAG